MSDEHDPLTQVERDELQHAVNALVERWSGRLEAFAVVGRLGGDGVLFRCSIDGPMEAVELLTGFMQGISGQAEHNGNMEMVEGMDLMLGHLMEVFGMQVVKKVKQ